VPQLPSLDLSNVVDRKSKVCSPKRPRIGMKSPDMFHKAERNAFDRAGFDGPRPPKSSRRALATHSARGRLLTSGEGANDYEFVEQALAKMRTGEDAISFFALHGSNTPVKFVHLNRVKAGKRFRPYDLVVVAPNAVDPEHFTISSAGIVRISPKEPSDFVSLAEWMRLSTIFNVIASIRFFKNYLIYKMFHAWRTSIRYNLYGLQRKRLSQKLFLAKKSFCEPLLEINRCISDIHHVMLLDLRSQKTYDAGQFAEHQGQKRIEASKELESIMEKVQLVVERVCNDATRRARITNEAFQSSINGMNNPRELKTRSLVALKEERAERILKLKIAMQEAGMLCDFIRLADYITVENLVGMCIKTKQDLLAELTKASRKSGMFETTVQFQKNCQISFSPNCNDICQMFGDLGEYMIRTVGSVPRIIFIRPFKGIVSPLIKYTPDVRNFILDSEEYKMIKDSIGEKVLQDFKDAKDYSKTFEQVMPIFVYNQEFDFERYKKRDDLSLQVIKKDMVVLSDWTKDLEKMRVGNTVGILHVESRKLRSSLVPITELGLERMRGLLADLSKQKCGILLEEYKVQIRELEAQPMHLKDFAAHVEFVQQLKMDTNAMMKSTATVEEMYRLCSSYGMKVSAVDMVQFDDLKQYTEAFSTKRKDAEAYIESRLPEMMQSLDMNIAKLGDQLGHLKEVITSGIFVDANAEPAAVLEEFEAVRQKLDQLDQLSKTYSTYQRLFNISVYEYKNLSEVEQDYSLYHSLWKTIKLWGEKTSSWYHCEFTSLDVETLSLDAQSIYKQAAMADKKIGNKVTSQFLESCTEFKARVPIILELGNPSMKERHWKQVFEVLKQPWFPSSTFTLDNLTDNDIFQHGPEIGEISASASGEAALESSLENIKMAWSETKFELLEYSDQKNVWILGSLDDIFTLLDDHQVTLQTMLGSRFLAGVQKSVETWQHRLSLLSDTLDEWATCQRNWMYLETIFSAPDIQEQLPEESDNFQMVDRLWKDAMHRIKNNPYATESISHKLFGITAQQDEEQQESRKLLERFQFCNKLLDEIQKSLENYLEKKRSVFSRFYFLSNDELLEILSQTRDPRAVQAHLSKCFDAIQQLEFDKDNIIYGMVSPETEQVALIDHIDPNEELVENWLSSVEKSMRKTLRQKMKECTGAYASCPETDRKEWIFSHPAQCILAVDQVSWTHNTTMALRKSTLPAHLEFSLEQIKDMIGIVRGSLSKLQRTLMGALIVLDVHARDVVSAFIAKNVSNESNFEWTRQLRYYYDAQEHVVNVRQTNTSFQYAYEYLGNTPRLVITPLTDLCYMTLTGALHLRFGGAPAGPAGTGKTETTKDLAKALAVQCVVFNCSDGLDFKIMGRFFSGLAQCGSWSCFDEFNRIDIEVLSVIAQQILTIQQGIIHQLDRIDFEGRMIPLNTNFGVFITMNPGYAGRTELPDNLKALFRPVAMMVPDYRLIAEITLFSEGFNNAYPLSNKMTQLYKLSSEQLSKQDHYDFGMRAVKSVLVAAGNLKRAEPETNEDLLLIRAMRDSNVPKFLENDLDLFRGILRDLFPGVNVPFVDYGALQVAIEDEIVKEQLVPVPSFVNKVIQVHETQLVRHGMMLVGQAGSGKTTNVRILAKALSSMFHNKICADDPIFRPVRRLILNPKAITSGELYGMFNELTGEWSDGIVPKLVRGCCVNDNGERKWIVFDGPVDAVWIENMNTVLDDNKTLCLANSERIKIPATVHMMFEVEDLAVASPATVSRCGMVYMEQVHIGIIAQIDAWTKQSGLQQLLPSQSGRINKLAKQHIPPALKFLKTCPIRIPVSDGHLTKSFLDLLQATLSSQEAKESHPSLERLVSMLFVFSFSWSFGSVVDRDERRTFSEFCTTELALLLDGAGKMDNVFNYFVEPTTAAFLPWSRAMGDFTYASNVPYFDLLVPTPDTTKYTYLLGLLCSNKRNVLCMGETGVGKSVIVSSYLNNVCGVDNDGGPDLNKLVPGGGGEFIQGTINCSARTRPHNIVSLLETSLEKKRKSLLGPPGGKRMLLFIDDINMPSLEKYGAQPPNELVRQVIDQGGYYDTSSLFFKSIIDMNVIAACAPPTGGRSKLPPRLLRHFHALWMPQLSSHSMKAIFDSILHGFLKAEIPSLASLSNSLVTAAVDLYKVVVKEMLPTPSKSHYTFNLRDLSKVIQGMLMVRKESCPTQNDLVKVWLHEESRVFRDRLLCEEDRAQFDQAALFILRKHVQDVEYEEADIGNLIYGDFETKDGRTDYRPLASTKDDIQQLADVFSDYLENYNISFPSPMHLVFFNDAVRHITRICRVLSQPRGNAMLVGVGGSGRQSLTRLATFVAGFKCTSIEMTRGYGVPEFHESLKAVLFKAGCGEDPVTFLFNDTQIVCESFLEDINNLLNSGVVPNLFQPEDIEQILAALRPIATESGAAALMNLFTERVRQNLHIVLAFSPVGALFRGRCRMFPSLVNCCNIDWFDPWPNDALYSVAQFFLCKDARKLGIENYIDPLCKVCVRIHKSVSDASTEYKEKLGRHNYTTPTSYLELIRTYQNMMNSQREIVSERLKRYENGLQKLLDTEHVVVNLQETLTNLVPNLEKAQEATDILLGRLAIDKKEADKVRNIAMKDEAIAQQVAAEVEAIKEECQADLDSAMPAYEDAVKALDSLDKKSIQEVKSFAQPPPLVAFTLEAVCILLGVKPDWATAKKILNDINFLQKLIDYDKDNIDPKKIRKLGKYVKEPDFNAEKMKSVSTAACSLCMWVQAMVIYDSVVRNIAPKKEKLAEAEASLEKVNKELVEKQAGVRTILEKVKALEAQYEASVQHKKDIEADAVRAELHLVRAQKLIFGLKDEKARWCEIESSLKQDLTNLVGNMMLATGCISYLGPFTADFRAKLTDDWSQLCRKMEIPVETDMSQVTTERFLGDPVVIRKWHIDGLPADNFSTENGLLATSGRRWPLMIDPQGQANKWIRNMYREDQASSSLSSKKALNIIKFSDGDFLRTLENSVQFGTPVLLENVGETLDATIEPILLKQVFKRGGQKLLRIGDSDIPYSDDFKLYITTKLPNPHYMPEVMVKVTIINFTVTLRGLEDQLLVDVVRCERAELEVRKGELVVSIANDKHALKSIEDNILHLLATSSGNILDDDDLIEELGKSKETSQTISTRMVETETTTEKINAAREEYRPVAVRGSILYFVIASLPNIDPMYQYSLQYFQKLFVQLIGTSPRHPDTAERIAILLSNITEKVFINICRGLFEKDKLIYSFKIAVEILRVSGEIKDNEWRHFLVGGMNEEHPSELDPPSFITEKKTWQELCALAESIEPLGDVIDDIVAFPRPWRQWVDHNEPMKEPLPGDWETTLSKFQKLLLVRSLRKEKLLTAACDFVGSILGTVYTVSPPFDLRGAYQDSTCATPIIFILSPGADVNDYFLEIAKECGKGGGRTKIVSLGQGQGPIAEQLIEEGRLSGGWVCLQNCHLAVSWLTRLEQLLEGSEIEALEGRIHPEHRLWLTSDPSPKFPVSILQNGIKITNEPPRGMRANICRVFADMPTDEYDDGSKNWKRLLFSLVFYNALILERRKFGSIGWNIPYGWMNADLKTATMQLRLYLEENAAAEVPFETLLVMVGDVTYGGRITDKLDQRTNRSILAQFFSQNVLEEDAKLVPELLGYTAPPLQWNLSQVRGFVDGLPREDNPCIFGLHPNANVTFQQNEANALLDSLIISQVASTPSKEPEHTEEEQDEVSSEPNAEEEEDSETEGDGPAKLAASILEKLEQMPELDLALAHEETFSLVDGRVNSLGVFLQQEISRFSHLRACVVSTCEELIKATQGLVVMSQPLEEMHNKLTYQKVPLQWENAGYPCLKPLTSWVEDFLERLKFCHRWLTTGPPCSYWISGFFFPQGFITSVLQVHVRKNSIPIDALKMRNTLVSILDPNDAKVGAPQGVYIHGLYLQGARVDVGKGMNLVDPMPGVLFDALPLVNLLPTNHDTEDDSSFYQCPVYKTSLRAGTLSTTGHSTNFVMSLDLPSDQPSDHWIRRGAALLCMLDL